MPYTEPKPKIRIIMANGVSPIELVGDDKAEVIGLQEVITKAIENNNSAIIVKRKDDTIVVIATQYIAATMIEIPV